MRFVVFPEVGVCFYRDPKPAAEEEQLGPEGVLQFILRITAEMLLQNSDRFPAFLPVKMGICPGQFGCLFPYARFQKGAVLSGESLLISKFAGGSGTQRDIEEFIVRNHPVQQEQLLVNPGLRPEEHFGCHPVKAFFVQVKRRVEGKFQQDEPVFAIGFFLVPDHSCLEVVVMLHIVPVGQQPGRHAVKPHHRFRIFPFAEKLVQPAGFLFLLVAAQDIAPVGVFAVVAPEAEFKEMQQPFVGGLKLAAFSGVLFRGLVEIAQVAHPPGIGKMPDRCRRFFQSLVELLAFLPEKCGKLPLFQTFRLDAPLQQGIGGHFLAGQIVQDQLPEPFQEFAQVIQRFLPGHAGKEFFQQGAAVHALLGFGVDGCPEPVEQFRNSLILIEKGRFQKFPDRRHFLFFQRLPEAPQISGLLFQHLFFGNGNFDLVVGFHA